MKTFIYICLLVIGLVLPAGAQVPIQSYRGQVSLKQNRIEREGNSLRLDLTISVCGLSVGRYQTLSLMPMLRSDRDSVVMAPVVLNGANKQKMYDRIVPLFGGETPKDWREYLYYHYYDYPAIHMVRRHDGVRDSRYKLIHFYGEKNEHNDAISCNELYDLQSDPNELNNLYDNPEYADIQTRLQARLDKFRVDQKVDEY